MIQTGIMSRRFDLCSKCNGKKDVRAKHCFKCYERKAVNVEHGDVRKYSRGCRCDLCRRANADYAAERKKRRPDLVKAEQRRYLAKNRDRINEKKRKNKADKRHNAAALAKRKYREAGVLIERELDDARSKYLVYALIDPTDLKTRYVGVSSTGLSRPRVHGTPSSLNRNENKRKENWIRNLQVRGLYYAIRVLEYFSTPEQAHAAEPYWIDWFRKHGEHLYNITAGNDTAIRASEETKEKMRKIMKGRVITWGHKISAAKRAKKK